MPRNLDLTSLRAFLTVAETGGVTRAAGFLNLTQSAVSMQLKRLEETLGQQLLDRTSRSVSLTVAGEQVLGYARKMLDMNDELLSRLTDAHFEGELVLGVPHDIIYPAIPEVLSRFNAEYPRVKVNLISSYTVHLKSQFDAGACDIILTTEDDPAAGGEILCTMPLIWMGARNGRAWRNRPLRVAFCENCRFRAGALRALEEAGIPWEIAVESEFDRAIEATVSADLAINAMLPGAEPPQMEPIIHNGALPALPDQKVALYSAEGRLGPVIKDLTEMIRNAYTTGQVQPLARAG